MSRVITVNPAACFRMPLHIQIFGAITLDPGFVDHIRLHGVQTLPEVCQGQGTAYMILKGARRLAGAIAAGLEEIEVVYKDELEDLAEMELEMLCDDDPELRRKQSPELIATMAAEAAKRLGSNRAAAKRLNIPRDRVNKLVAVVKERDRLREAGDHGRANEISEQLNHGVAPASRMIPRDEKIVRKPRSKEPEVVPPADVRKRRGALVKTEKLFDGMSKAIAEAVQADGGICDLSRDVLGKFEEFKAAVAAWRAKP